MNNKVFTPNDSLPNGVSSPAVTPLARVSGSRIEVFPENHALQFDGQPRLIPIISNQRVNRVLSRFPVNIPTRFAPSLPKGEKVFEPSTKMQERLKSLQRNLSRIYEPEESKEITGEIPVPVVSLPPSIPSLPPTPPPIGEIEKLREELAQKEMELAAEKTGKQRLNEVIKTYQGQIQTLTEKTKNLTREISETEDALTSLREEATTLGAKVSQQKPPYQEKEGSVSELKTSLAKSSEVIADLQEKLREKEKLLQKLLAESSTEREKAKKLFAEKNASEALIRNLRAALENARQELKKAQEQKITPEELWMKEEQINKLTERLRQKEEENKKIQEEAEKARGILSKEQEIRGEIETFQREITNLQKQNQTLTGKLQTEEKELENLRSSVGRLSAENKEKEEKLIEQENYLINLRTQKEKLSLFADELSKKLTKIQAEKHLETIVEAELGEKEVKKPTLRVVAQKPAETFTKPLTNLPNAINGMVMAQNEKLIENAVVIIKDQNDNPLRALRTNELGQFLVATPLPSGIYHLEIESKGEKFDILEVELTGEVLAPIEIKAK